MFRKLSSLFVPALLMLAPTAANAAQSLTGSWEFTLNPDSPSASPVSMAIDGLATFTSDRTVIETDAAEVVGHATPGHGIWQQGPIPNGYLFVQFVSLTPYSNGLLHSKRTLTMLVTVNPAGDQFTGTYEFLVVNAAGTTIGTGGGTVTGKLIPHPLLP